MWKLTMLWAKFRKELLMVWAMVRDPRAPLISKITAIAAAIYVISPIDLIPDAIPILGWMDDGVVLVLLTRLALKFLPPELYASLQEQVEKRTKVQR